MRVEDLNNGRVGVSFEEEEEVGEEGETNMTVASGKYLLSREE